MIVAERSPSEAAQPSPDRGEFFVQGPIDPSLVGKCIERFAENPRTGGQLVFLGQIRADEIDAGTVAGIEYTAHEGMARTALAAIVERAAREGPLIDVVVHHSLGYVPVGGSSLLIAVATGHRDEAYRLSRFILEAIKDEVPIYGREITDGENFRWKVNR
jgi:molybdopterin synthase catalytic subunit